MKEREPSIYHQIDLFLNGMNTRFYLIVCLPLLLFVLVYLEVQSRTGISPAFESGDHIGHYVLSLVLGLSWFPAKKMYKRKILEQRQEESLMQKLNAFRKAAIYMYLILGSAAILAIVGLYFAQEQIYLMAFGIVLILFSVNRPTPAKIIKDMKLTAEEKRMLSEYRKFL